MNDLHFEELQTVTGRIIDVFDELETQTIWHQLQKDMYIIFHQEVKPEQQFCYGYTGEVATIIIQNKLFIKLNALRNNFPKKPNNVDNKNALIQNNEQFKDSSTWQIDLYTMKECTDLDYKIKRQIFNVNCYKDKLKGSFELASYDFKHALLEILNSLDILVETKN